VTHNYVGVFATEGLLEAQRVLALEAMLPVAEVSIVGRRYLQAILSTEPASSVERILLLECMVREQYFHKEATVRLGRSTSHMRSRFSPWLVLTSFSSSREYRFPVWSAF
jgi:hypothetical protein